MSNQPNSKRFDFSLGYPDLAVAPKELLAELSSIVLSAGRGLQYGGDLKGSPFAREQIAAFLHKQFGAAVQQPELMISTGSVQALDVICRTLTKPGDVVLVEAPTFFFAIDLFRMSHTEVVGVPLHEDGLDLEVLQHIINQYGSRIKMLYSIPSYQNPTGWCAPAGNRQKVVELAQRHNFIVLEDTAYHLLNFDSLPPPLMRQYDRDAGGRQVVTVGTFSKLLAPALRQGWIWATPDLINRFTKFKTDASTSLLTCDILGEYLKRGGIDSQIEELRDFYKNKCERMLKALQHHMPKGVTWSIPGGGFYIWGTLPEGVAAKDVQTLAQAQGGDFLPGRLCFPEPVADRTMRLCFAYLPEDRLDEGTALLGSCVREVMGRAKSH